MENLEQATDAKLAELLRVAEQQALRYVRKRKPVPAEIASAIRSLDAEMERRRCERRDARNRAIADELLK